MGVYKNNLVSIEFTAQEKATINDALRTINGVLDGKMINLTPEERMQYGSVHERNKLFVNKARDFVQRNPQHIPAYLDMPEFMRDYDARVELEGFALDVNPLYEKLQDTKIALDFDNYQAALSIYSYVQLLSHQNVPGMSSWHQEMKQFFPRTKRSNSTAEEPATTEEAADE